MNILYMGYFCREETFNKLVKNGSHSSHARQQLETKLLEGLISERQNNSIEIISYMPYRRKVKKEVGKGEKYHDIDIKYVWCNKKNPFSIVKAIIQNRRLIRAWAKQCGKKIVITYSVNPIFVIPLFRLRKRLRYKVVTLCSEVSVYRRTDKVGLATRVSRKIASLLDNNFDGYVLLTPYMNELVNNKQRPYLLMEGVADDLIHQEEVQGYSRSVILYAGGLTEDNGIKILLDGFVMSGCTTLQLSICGEGPMENEVKKYAANYDNIYFHGILSNKKIRQMEREAMLLISPRLSKSEFTKYSFPSKTIEYMSSGTPVVLTRLAGIPDEYFDFAYVLEDETPQGMAELIQKISQLHEEERQNMAKLAQNFVVKNKNPRVQALRILFFLETLLKE